MFTLLTANTCRAPYLLCRASTPSAKGYDYKPLQQLIDSGVDLNMALNNGGGTAVMACAYTGDDSAMKLLLQGGADPNRASLYNGETALHIAAERHKVKCVEALVAAGADLNTKDKEGAFALPAATAAGVAAGAAVRERQEERNA